MECPKPQPATDEFFITAKMYHLKNSAVGYGVCHEDKDSTAMGKAADEIDEAWDALLSAINAKCKAEYERGKTDAHKPPFTEMGFKDVL